MKESWKSILNKQSKISNSCQFAPDPKYVQPKRMLNMKQLLEKYPTATLIKTWDELEEYCNNNPSDTHTFEYGRYNGWLKPKDGSDRGKYLSTHCFYQLNYGHSTLRFQEGGFNVIIDNWDGREKSDNKYYMLEVNNIKEEE